MPHPRWLVVAIASAACGPDTTTFLTGGDRLRWILVSASADDGSGNPFLLVDRCRYDNAVTYGVDGFYLREEGVLCPDQDPEVYAPSVQGTWEADDLTITTRQEGTVVVWSYDIEPERLTLVLDLVQIGLAGTYIEVLKPETSP